VNQPISDAEWAAREAIAALQDGRYKLGASLAHLAMRAHQQATQGAPEGPADVRTVPFLGSTRDEQPSRPTDGPAPLYAVTADQLGQDAAQHVDETLAGHAPMTERCRWTASVPGDFCWAAIYVDAGMWRHIDPEYDKNHPATPTPPGSTL
jgi:hypothetical protein